MSHDHYGYFEQSYVCSSVSNINRPQLESGDKIIMPASALERLSLIEIDYPMLFELQSIDRVSHCGVLEFVADEGMVYLPEWMMNNLEFEEGEILRVKNVALPKGSFIKLQPHSSDFLDISNPKAMLETALRSYTCLTTGDTIMVFYNNKKYFINVVETKPSNAVSVVETDCEVDFAPPLDYKAPEKPAPKVAESVQEAQELSLSELRPFTGTGRRLDGKLVERPSEQPVLMTGSQDNKAGSPSSSNSGSGGASRKAQGKVVFGSKKCDGNNIIEDKKEPTKQTSKKPEKKEESKFQAFTGKSYSLK